MISNYTVVSIGLISVGAVHLEVEQMRRAAHHDAIPLGLFNLFSIEPKVIWSLV